MLKSLFCPKEYVGGVPCDSPVPLALKDLTIYSVIKPGTQVGQSGFLIWNVLRGCYSVMLAAMPTSFDIQVNRSGVYTAQPVPVNSATPTPIPYNNSTEMLNIKPDLAATMSMGRLTAGSLTLYSATTSTTLAAINGQLCGTSVTDLRNCNSFSVPDMVQAASCVKDGVCNVRPAVGLTTVVGPDIGSQVKVIDYDQSTTWGWDGKLKGPLASVPSLPFTSAFNTGTFFNSNFDGTGLASFFSIYGRPWTGFVPYGVDVAMSLEIAPQFPMAPTSAPYGGSVEFAIGTIDSSGVVGVRVVVANFESSGVGTAATVPFSVLKTDRVRIGFNEVLIYAAPLLAVLPGGGAGAFNITPTLEAYNVYGDNGFGAYRVLRWDNVDNTQTINIKGTFMVEGVPSGSIAPFVKGNHKMVSHDVGHVMSHLRSIFSNPSVFTRRVFLSSHESDNYENDAARAVGSTMAAGMYAAGMYAGGLSDIGKALGGVVGDVAGTGLSLIGSGLDDTLGALFAAGDRKRPRISL